MATKSGSFWVTWANSNARNSKNVDDLKEPFRTKAKEFIAALKKAGATVDIDTTKRSEKRAYLFHWAWRISLGKCRPSDATALSGVDIQWNHGDDAASKKGAQEMVKGFGLAVPPASVNAPALTSHHIAGNAIDMTVRWHGTMKVKDQTGRDVAITFMADVNANKVLHTVGATYGVKKLVTDAPHWSHDGH